MYGNVGGGMFQAPGRPDMGLGPGGGMGSGGGEQESQRKHGRFYKTRLCHAFQQGRCSEGAECKYAHGEADLRPPQPDTMPGRPQQQQQQQPLPMPPKAGQQPQQQAGPDPNQEGVVVRVHICRQFVNTGTCRYGDNCKFAHGEEMIGSTVLRPDQVGAPGVGDPSAMRHPAGGLPGPPGRPLPPPGGRDMPMGMLLEPFGSLQGGAMAPPGMRPPLMPMHGPLAGHAGPLPPPGPPPPGTPAAMTLQQVAAKPGAAPGAGPKQAPQQAGSAAGGKAAAAKEVLFVDRVRAVCALLNIGNAAEVLHDKPAALHHAVATIRNGSVFRENPFADSVEHIVL